jgi:hypothetical protein
VERSEDAGGRPSGRPRPPRRWSVIIMARAVTTGKVCSARDKCARRIDALKKARDGYAQDWGDSTDPVTVAFRTDGGHVSCSQHEVERCHGRPEDSQGREVLGCGGEHYVRSAMLRMPPRQQSALLLRQTHPHHPTRCRRDHHDKEQGVREATDWRRPAGASHV